MKRSFIFLGCLFAISSAIYGQIKYPVFKRYEDPGTKDHEKAMLALEKQAYRTGVEEFDQVIHRNRLGLRPNETYRCLDLHFRRISIDSVAKLPRIKTIRDTLALVSKGLKEVQQELSHNSMLYWAIPRKPYIDETYKQHDSTFYFNVFQYLKFIKSTMVPMTRKDIEKRKKESTVPPAEQEQRFTPSVNLLNRYETLANRCIALYNKLNSVLDPELLVIIHQSRADNFYYLFHQYEISGIHTEKKTMMHKYMKGGQDKNLWFIVDRVDFEEQLTKIRNGRF